MSLYKLALVAVVAAAQGTAVEVAKVSSQTAEKTLRLPGEFLPYQSVDLHARVTGFVEQVKVDVGSAVGKGDVLATLTAPEMAAGIAESQARTRAVEAQRPEAQARLRAAESTYERLKAASATPGAIAGNELVLAEKSVQAAGAAVEAIELSAQAVGSSIGALREMEKYLVVTAPFDGIITQRYAHPGALVGPQGGSGSKPLLRLEQLSRLRLTVAVPEASVSGIVKGAHVKFTLPAYPGESFAGIVARISYSMDPRTRTMPVEVDVQNPRRRIAPGMYPEVQWPVRAQSPSLWVPQSSVAVTTERSFVIRLRDGRAEWVDIRKGAAAGDLVEVFGPLQAGDEIVARATDEIREGSPLEGIGPR